MPALSGALWLAFAVDHGWVAYLLGALPGAMLLATGLAAALWPGDPRPLQVGAMSATLSCGLGVAAFAWTGIAPGLLLMGLAAASFVAFGALSLGEEVSRSDVPLESRSVALASAVAVDEALLGFIVPLALRRRSFALVREGLSALEFFTAQGWLEKPAAYHEEPPPLDSVELESARSRGLDFEHVSFESGYAPHPDEPGRERWLGYERCRTAHAWLVRHDSPERPWLVCVHGLMMGWPWVDLAAFRAERLNRRLGLNLIFPLLPFHGPRGHGRISGSGFLSERILDSVHAFAQACWDLRRLLSWIRAQGGRRIGVHGLSLGGYTSALLASLDDDLACAISGVPAVDFAELAWRHSPPYELQRFEREGLDRDALRNVLRPVAPLALTPKVPHERRYIYGSLADRLVPPDQIRALWQHWGEPRIHWYAGSHVNFLLFPSVRRFVDEALRESLLMQSPES